MEGDIRNDEDDGSGGSTSSQQSQSASSQQPRQPSPESGYLDDVEKRTRSTLLLRHLQGQPYHRLVRPGESAVDSESSNDDDVTDDQEHERRQARRGSSSTTFSISTWDSEEEERRAQQEWEENIAQLQLAFQVMLLPFFGKWLGRRWSYWAFTRYQMHGFSSAFFGLQWIWAPTTIVPDAAVAVLQP